MTAREITDRVFMGIAAFGVIANFFPVITVQLIYDDSVKFQNENIMEGQYGFILMILSITTLICALLCKRIIASVMGFVTAATSAFMLFLVNDRAVTVAKWMDDPDSAFGGFIGMSGIRNITATRAAGFYLVMAGAILLALISIINLIVRDKER